MKKNYLFSPVYRKIGYCLMALAVILAVVPPILFGDFIHISIPMFSLTPGILLGDESKLFSPHIEDAGWFEFAMTFMCIGCVFVAFSKEKDEDECIAHIRTNALMWSLMINMAFVLITTWIIYGADYLTVMAIYPFSTFILFMIIYNVSLYKFRKNNEE